MADQITLTSDDERVAFALDLGWDDDGSADDADAFFTAEHLTADGRSLPDGVDQTLLDEVRDAVVRRMGAAGNG